MEKADEFNYLYIPLKAGNNMIATGASVYLTKGDWREMISLIYSSSYNGGN